jgi:hypothetical protein
VSRPALQVLHVSTATESGTEPRNDVVIVTMQLARSSSGTRPTPYHTMDVEVFNAIGDWWDAQVDHEEAEELATHGG